jgi:hypothetical protein
MCLAPSLLQALLGVLLLLLLLLLLLAVLLMLTVSAGHPTLLFPV